MKRTRGCPYEHPFPVKCARARELEAGLSRAIRAGDWPRMHAIGDQVREPHVQLGKDPPLSKEARR